MKQLYSTFSIAKKLLLSSLSLSLILISPILFNGINAFASDDVEVTGNFYAPDFKEASGYKNKIEWKVTNITDWTVFVNKLQELPKGPEIESPLSLKQSGIVHFTQINPDKISGNDIYLSEIGIQQFARMPTDTYQYNSKSFRGFLEREMEKRAGYGEPNHKDIDLNALGVIVVYRGSTMLNNPNWRIGDVKSFQKYATYIDKLKPLPSGQTLRTELEKTNYDDLGTFIVYLNYPGAPYQFLSVTESGGVRGTKIDKQKYFFKDDRNYYAVFKKQAEDMIRAEDDRRNNSDLKRAQDRF